MITYDEFSKIQLVIGTIIEVREHPDADKLYIVTVDIGEKEIQLVAGLKQQYQREELVHKQVVVVTNLSPRVLRGVESQGMLLAGQDGSRVRILTTDETLAPGSPVR